MSTGSLRRRGLLASLVVVAVILAGCAPDRADEERSRAPRAEATPASVPGAVAAVNAFAADLLGALPTDGNVVVSPYAVALVLAMARAGAGGQTRQAFDEVLHQALAGDLDQSLNSLQREVSTRSGERRSDLRKGAVALDVAAEPWAQQETQFEPTYLDALARSYGTGIRVVDFRSDPDAARRSINSWAASQTGGRITSLLPRGAISEFTRFVLPSALSLRAPWKVRFDPQATKPAPFTLLDGSSAEVPTMRASSADTYAIGRGDRWQAVSIPYLGDELRMVIIVPDPGAFTEVAAGLGPGPLADVLASLTTAPVELHLPRFQFTTDIDLEPALSSLGLGGAFAPGQADFSLITDDEPLVVSRATHQTYAAADETGSDGDAATVVPAETPVVTGAQPVVVDRPFLFAVVDRSGVVLQIGRVLDPTG